MADPATMAGISIGSSIIGGIFGVKGASEQAQAQAQAWNFKAGIADLNAQISKQNAAWALNSGAIKAENLGLKAAQEIGSTKVKQAAGNIDTTTGSAQIVRDTQGDVAKFEQGIITADAAHTAYGYEMKAAADTTEAAMDRSAAANARKAGDTNILSSILGTVSSVASKWSQGNMIGIFGSSSKGSYATDGIGGYGPTAPDQPSWSTG